MIVKINGYEIDTSDKHVAAQGFWYVAKKGGQQYFLKQYNPAKPIPPSEGGGSEKVYEKKLKSFEKRVAYRKRLNQAIRSFTAPGGNIVIPADEFVCQLPDDSGKNYVFYWEATEFIPDVIPEENLEATIRGLDVKDKLLVMATAAGALHTVHQHGIVHSDLKLGNVLLAKNSNKKIVTKLIDFDGSYFLDDKDTLIAGDEVYCSPELLLFYSDEDNEDEYKERLNEKSDIFSLGLIYHFYLSGHLPVGVDLPERLEKQKEKGALIHCSEVLLSGGKLEISDKILSLKYRLLIRDMLELDPKNRPTAIQVLTRLKEPEVDFSAEEPWPEHNIVLKADKIKAANYAILRRTTVGGVAKYELTSKSGKVSVLTKEELLAQGLAAAAVIVDVFDDPWPEHGISIDADKLKSKKYVSEKRETFKTFKGYNLYRADGTCQFFTLDKMLMYGFAYKGAKKTDVGVGDSGKKKTDVGVDVSGEKGSFKTCEPWPGDTIYADKLSTRGYVGIERAELKGKKGYNLYTSSTSKRFVLRDNLKMMGFIG